MILDNLDLEIFKFKERLIASGVDSSTAETLADRFRKSAKRVIDDVMNDGTQQAVDAGIAKKSKEFIEDIKPDDSRFEITTASGKRDYSINAFSMRAGLLKNAKVSKTGTRYKVIPIGQESSVKPDFLSLDNIQMAQAAKMRAKIDLSRANMGAKRSGGKQEFRTITDKQPINSWVHPGFQRDMGPELDQINMGIKHRLEYELQSMMDEMEENAPRGDDL